MFASRHAGTKPSLTNQKVRWDRSGQSEDKGRYLLNNGTWTIRLSVANILMRGLTHFWSSQCVRIMNEKTFLETFSFCRCFIRKTESEEIKEFLHPNKIRYLETKSSEVLEEKMLRHSRMGNIAQIFLKTFIHNRIIFTFLVWRNVLDRCYPHPISHRNLFVERRLESDSIKSSDIGGTLCRVTRIIEKLKILKILGHGERAGVVGGAAI